MGFIDAHCDRFGGVEQVCRVLTESGYGINASTYYSYRRTRTVSRRAMRDAELKSLIGAVYAESCGRAGARRIWQELNRRGHDVARCTVERLMREMGIAGGARGTAASPADRPAASPVIWAVGLAAVPMGVDTAYVALVIDVRSRRVLGWAVGAERRPGLVYSALETSLCRRGHAGSTSRLEIGLAGDLVESGLANEVGRPCGRREAAVLSSAIGLYRNALRARGRPSASLRALEAITESWVAWYNTSRRATRRLEHRPTHSASERGTAHVHHRDRDAA